MNNACDIARSLPKHISINNEIMQRNLVWRNVVWNDAKNYLFLFSFSLSTKINVVLSPEIMNYQLRPRPMHSYYETQLTIPFEVLCIPTQVMINSLDGPRTEGQIRSLFITFCQLGFSSKVDNLLESFTNHSSLSMVLYRTEDPSQNWRRAEVGNPEFEGQAKAHSFSLLPIFHFQSQRPCQSSHEDSIRHFASVSCQFLFTLLYILVTR